MTKIRTAYQLEEVISQEFAWRKKELYDVKTLVWKNKGNRLEALSVRSGVAVLYAHWEGFIKKVGSAYLEFVARQQLANQELCDCFLALSSWDLAKTCGASNQIEDHIKLVRFFRNELGKKSRIAFAKTVNTRSNLQADVFKNIVLMLGLDYSPYESKEKLIDEQLLKNRNSIAHGEFLIIDATEYLDVHENMVELMQVFYDQVSNASVQKSFKTL